MKTAFIPHYTACHYTSLSLSLKYKTTALFKVSPFSGESISLLLHRSTLKAKLQSLVLKVTFPHVRLTDSLYAPLDWTMTKPKAPLTFLKGLFQYYLFQQHKSVYVYHRRFH